MKFQRNFGFEFLSVILFVYFHNAESLVSTRIERSEPETEDVGSPLLLTPLIEAGKIEDAREQAKVEHPDMLNISSYAGYFTLNKTYNANMFFWYFPAEVDPENAPVMLCLQSGPSTSLIFSFVMYSGPFAIDSSDVISHRNTSWNKLYNVIYVDNPIDAGYSFMNADHDGYELSQSTIAQELLGSMTQFFKLFPSLRKNDFFVMGESFAGKYVLSICHAIHEHNPTTENDKINLKGLAIANAYIDPIHQLAWGDYLYHMGLIDENGQEEFHKLEKKLHDLITEKKYTEISKEIENFLYFFGSQTFYKSIFNILKPRERLSLQSAIRWIYRTDVRRSLHVGNTTFNDDDEAFYNFLVKDLVESNVHLLADLLNHYRVVIVSGQFNWMIPYPGVENYLKHLEWSGADDYKKAPRKPWMVNDELAGYYKISGNLGEFLVKDAGHNVAYDQPEWMNDLLEKFISSKDL